MYCCSEIGKKWLNYKKQDREEELNKVKTKRDYYFRAHQIFKSYRLLRIGVAQNLIKYILLFRKVGSI